MSKSLFIFIAFLFLSTFTLAVEPKEKNKTIKKTKKTEETTQKYGPGFGSWFFLDKTSFFLTPGSGVRRFRGEYKKVVALGADLDFGIAGLNNFHLDTSVEVLDPVAWGLRLGYRYKLDVDKIFSFLPGHVYLEFLGNFHYSLTFFNEFKVSSFGLNLGARLVDEILDYLYVYAGLVSVDLDFTRLYLANGFYTEESGLFGTYQFTIGVGYKF